MSDEVTHRYRIYGDAGEQFLGFIQARNMDEDTLEHALELSKEPLNSRGMNPLRVEKEEVNYDTKLFNNDVSVTFLYDKSNDFELMGVSDMPVIRVLQDNKLDSDECESCGRSDSDIAIGFGDLKVAENLLHCMLDVVRYLREKKNKETMEGIVDGINNKKESN